MNAAAVRRAGLVAGPALAIAYGAHVRPESRGAHFREDHPRRTDDDFYEVIGDDSGVFGCMSLLACHDVCPKDLPLQTQIAFIRRKMVAQGFK